MLRFAFVLLAIGCMHNLYSQPTGTYLSMGVGTSFYTLRDSTVSPMTYRGNPFAASVGLELQRSKALTGIYFSGDLGKLRSANATNRRPMQSNVYRIDLLVQHFRWLSNASARWRWHVGGVYRWHNSIRITPQNDTGMISFLIANSLGMGGGFAYPFTLFTKSITFSGQTEIPVISHVIRPSYLNLYNYIDPENDFLKERLKAGKWATINRFPAIIFRHALYYPIAGQNQLKLSYEWAFYHYALPSVMNAARHTLLLQLLVRI